MSSQNGWGGAWKLIIAGFSLTLILASASLETATRSVLRGGLPAVTATSFPSGPAGQRYCPLSSRNPLVFDSPEPPDTLDPAVSFSFGGWGALGQAYQTLVQYNQSSPTDFYGVLADSWTISPDFLNYTFHLRSGVHFSNGDPANAYTMWFSLNRALATNSSSQFFLSQNFWYPGITYGSPYSAQANAWNYLMAALNTWDFLSPTSSQLAGMQATNQSFQVVDARTIVLHVGAGYLGAVPYAYLLATLAAPVASAVDPPVVQANGGVSPNYNAYMSTHMVGTGPYVLSTMSGTGYLLTPDPNYWGSAAAAAEPWNTALQAARSSIAVDVQTDSFVVANDLASGQVAGVTSGTLDSTTYASLATNPCLVTKVLPPVYGSAVWGWWMFMDRNAAPFSNLSVRRAVTHAVNYDAVMAVAFGGYARRWVGPVPAGYPDANPNGLAPYAYDVALARADMNASPWPLPTGYPATLNYLYPNFSPWPTVAVLIQADLAKIGISIHPVPVSLSQLFTIEIPNGAGVCTSETTYAGGPFPIGLDFWSADYLAPDDWTQNMAASYGVSNFCMSQYANATMDRLVFQAAAETNPTARAVEYAQMTQLMYDDATNVWLVIPDQFQAYHTTLRGLVSNPMGASAEFALTDNTLSSVPQLMTLFTSGASPGYVNVTETFNANTTGGTPPYAYTWEFGDSATATGTTSTTSHVYTRAGNYTVNVTVDDSVGGNATESLNLEILAGNPPQPPSPAPPPAVIPYATVAGISIAAIAAIAGTVFLARRRRRKAPPPTNPPSPPT